MKKFQGKLTYANVVATLALFLVLTGGAAYAASHLTKNSVGTKQLKNGAVTQQKISAMAQAALIGQREAGPPGVTNLVVRESASVSISGGSSAQASVSCQGSEKATGGGGAWVEATEHNMRLLESGSTGPLGTAPTGWEVIGSNDTGSPKHLVARVVCASP